MAKIKKNGTKKKKIKTKTTEMKKEKEFEENKELEQREETVEDVKMENKDHTANKKDKNKKIEKAEEKAVLAKDEDMKKDVLVDHPVSATTCVDWSCDTVAEQKEIEEEGTDWTVVAKKKKNRRYDKDTEMKKREEVEMRREIVNNVKSKMMKKKTGMNDGKKMKFEKEKQRIKTKTTEMKKEKEFEENKELAQVVNNKSKIMKKKTGMDDGKNMKFEKEKQLERMRVDSKKNENVLAMLVSDSDALLNPAESMKRIISDALYEWRRHIDTLRDELNKQDYVEDSTVKCIGNDGPIAEGLESPSDTTLNNLTLLQCGVVTALSLFKAGIGASKQEQLKDFAKVRQYIEGKTTLRFNPSESLRQTPQLESNPQFALSKRCCPPSPRRLPRPPDVFLTPHAEVDSRAQPYAAHSTENPFEF